MSRSFESLTAKKGLSRIDIRLPNSEWPKTSEEFKKLFPRTFVSIGLAFGQTIASLAKITAPVKITPSNSMIERLLLQEQRRIQAEPRFVSPPFVIHFVNTPDEIGPFIPIEGQIMIQQRLLAKITAQHVEDAAAHFALPQDEFIEGNTDIWVHVATRFVGTAMDEDNILVNRDAAESEFRFDTEDFKQDTFYRVIWHELNSLETKLTAIVFNTIPVIPAGAGPL